MAKRKKRARRAGSGKSKGSSFEREVCKDLSRWVSGGKHEDLFWRSAMSGGRATVGRKKGKSHKAHAGDITCTHARGHALTDYWCIECKFYRDLNIDLFMFDKGGNLDRFWKQAWDTARNHDKEPMLIAKQNFKPTIVVVPLSTLDDFQWARLASIAEFDLHDVAILDYDTMVASDPAFRYRVR
jgi:hypothetical protein